jgi:hypothetical protein
MAVIQGIFEIGPRRSYGEEAVKIMSGLAILTKEKRACLKGY